MQKKDHSAGLIGQAIPDMAGTEPRPNRERVKAVVLKAQKRIESELPEDEHDHIPEWCYVAIVETALAHDLVCTCRHDSGASSACALHQPVKDEPFFVEVDVNGCDRCGHGKQWTVVGPDGVQIGQSFEDEELAEEIACYMNQGYRDGCGGE
jgi:hypothetical protein